MKSIKKPNPILSITGIVLFLLGSLSGLFLFAMSVWGDLESSTFGAGIPSEGDLTSLKCPVLITNDEVGVVSVTIDNPSDREVEPMVLSRITLGFVTLVEEERVKVPIPPGETRTLTWEVTREDAAYRRLVLVRIYQFANFSLPSRQASCGIVVLPISGLSGQQFFILSYAFGALAIAGGLLLWIKKREGVDVHIEKLTRTFIFFGVYVFIAILLSLVVPMLINVLMFVFAVICMIVIFSFASIGK